MNSNVPYKVNKANVVSEKFDDEVVIINLDSGNYYSLKEIGFNIWSLVENGASADEIVEWIMSQYDFSNAEEINKSVSQFIAELTVEGLIISDGTLKNKNIKTPDTQTEKGLIPGKSLFDSNKIVLQKYTDMQDFLLVDPIHEVEYTDWPKS
jgi:hypothetical protein